MKHQIPSTNNQIMIKIPMTEIQGRIFLIGFWCLDIIWNLGFGDWNFTRERSGVHVFKNIEGITKGV